VVSSVVQLCVSERDEGATESKMQLARISNGTERYSWGDPQVLIKLFPQSHTILLSTPRDNASQVLSSEEMSQVYGRTGDGVIFPVQVTRKMKATDIIKLDISCVVQRLTVHVQHRHLFKPVQQRLNVPE
jgi:hypothetical protein